MEAATRAVDMCVPSILREQDQQAAEKERLRKASELAEVNLLYYVNLISQGLASQCKAQEKYKERLDLGVTWLK